MVSSTATRGAQDEDRLDRVFRALGDRTRRELMRRLTHQPSMVTELASHFDMTLAAVGKHLRVLERAGLIERTIRGRVHHCSLNAVPLQDADRWLETYRVYWDETLDALVRHFEAGPADREQT